MSIYSDCAIRVSALCKSFDDRKILHNLNFDLPTGATLGLLALNGSGKTTLIKLILGIIFPDSGNIEIFGKSFLNQESRQDLFYLPERFSPPDRLTCHEAISGIVSIKRYDKPSMSEIEEVFCAIDLDPRYMHTKICLLSKGTAQKVGIAICFLSGKKLLIMDEPMGGLDVRSQRKFCSALSEYVQRNSATCLFTSHIIHDLTQVCSHFSVLKNFSILGNEELAGLDSRDRKLKLDQVTAGLVSE